MAAIVNARDVLLQAAGTRLLPVQLPSNYTTTGDHSGTLTGSPQTNFQNSQIQLSNTGQLLNAGGGGLDTLDDVGGNFLGFWESVPRLNHRNDVLTLTSDGTLSDNGTPRGNITDLDYGNVSGSKPPSNATSNFFSISGSNPSGGSDGDAHWNSSTQTMWFKTGGVWRIGGTVNANEIITGTLAAARIASNSITADKVNIGALDDISSNLGTISNGTLTSNVDLDVFGLSRFRGSTSQGGTTYAAVFNTSGGAARGIFAEDGVYGQTSSDEAIQGIATSPGGIGVNAIGSGGATALEATGGAINLFGSISITTQTISNLTAGSANNVSGSNVSGTVGSAQTAVTAGSADTADFATNASQLNSISSSGYCRFMVTDSGTATASSTGIVLTATVSGVRTRATGGRNVVIESFSDEQLKFDIKPETLGLNFLMKLTPITYQVKHNPGITYHGLGARAMEKILQREKDSLCITHDDGVKGIDYNSMIGVLIKAVQELNEKVNELEIQLIEGNP